MHRAQRIKTYLISKGVEKQRITVAARGACCYASDNDTPEGRARNRRVEVLFGNNERNAGPGNDE